MGGGVGDELASLLGRPLDVAERDKALAIVRANEGVESAAATARQYVDAAEEACADLPPGAGHRRPCGAAPLALLDSRPPSRPDPAAVHLGGATAIWVSGVDRRRRTRSSAAGGVVAPQRLARSAAWSTIGAG